MDRINTATKAPDLFGPGKHGWKDGNKALGIAATDFNAEWFNGTQEELVGLEEYVGLMPSAADRTQVRQAIEILIRWCSGAVAVAGGTVDAITAAFSPGVTALVSGMRLQVRAAGANTSTMPTFKADGTAAKTIVRAGNLPLLPGDIWGAGHWLQLTFDATLDKYVLLNPAAPRTIEQIAASVNANALTVTLQPSVVEFRSATLTSGAINSRILAAAANLVVPAGATLGMTANQTYRLAILALDNAGTIEPAIVNLAGGVNLDESGVISTTAISAAANSSSVVYSQAARASVPYRVRGFLDSAQAVPGTWASAPLVVQGAGGVALAALMSIGYGQTWQNVGPSRSSGTTYYNTTGRPIFVSINTSIAPAAGHSLFVNGVTVSSASNPTGQNLGSWVGGVVPPGGSYIMSVGSGGSTVGWVELR